MDSEDIKTDQTNECNCGGESCDCGDECKCGTEKETNIDYKDMYIHLLADFDNHRKRTAHSIYEARLDGVFETANVLLPSIDNLDQAMTMISDDNTLKGLTFVKKNILSSLESIGIAQIDTSGAFDPTLHNAVGMDEEANVPVGNIVRELSAGYRYGDRVIKYSTVIVKKGE